MYNPSRIVPDRQARSSERTPSIAGWTRQWPFVVQAWRENHAARRRLCQCAALDRRFAQDIGLTQGEVAMLCAERPWKPVRGLEAASDRPIGRLATGSPSVLGVGRDL